MTTNFTNVTSWNGLLRVANDNTSGFFWTGILYMLFIVATLLFAPFNFEVGLLAGAFLGLMSGIFLSYMGLVDWKNVLVFVALILFEIIYIQWKQRQ